MTPVISASYVVSDVCLLNGNLFYTTFVAAAFEVGAEEGLNNVEGFFVRKETCWKGNNVGIVVGTCQTGNFWAPAQARTHTLVLV